MVGRAISAHHTITTSRAFKCARYYYSTSFFIFSNLSKYGHRTQFNRKTNPFARQSNFYFFIFATPSSEHAQSRFAFSNQILFQIKF